MNVTCRIILGEFILAVLGKVTKGPLFCLWTICVYTHSGCGTTVASQDQPEEAASRPRKAEPSELQENGAESVK